MIKAIAFDLDGVLIDSEPIWYAANRNTFRQHGIDFSPQDHIKYWITSSTGLGGMCKQYNLNLDQIRKEREQEYLKLAPSITPMTGVPEIVHQLGAHYRCVLVSWSPVYAVNFILDHLNIRNVFETVITAHDVVNSKPHPEPYLTAAARMSLDPSHCIAIEDSAKGVQSAKAAGMKCIAIPNKWTHAGDFSMADHRVSSLCAVTVELIESLDRA